MRDKFREYELADARLEPFEFNAWRRGAPARLTMPGREFPCYALPYGAAADVRAPVIDVGGGSDAELAAAGGKLVLTTAASGHRREVYARCVERGAVGFILINGVPGMLLHTGSVGDGELGAIPAVSVAHETGQLIKRLAGLGEFALATTGHCERATTWNVVGEWPGSDELVIMGGHLDSHEIGPGAYDNAAGAVVVLETARLLAPHRRHFTRTLRFIGFGAEEVGLLGSQHYARTHADELRRARWMLNCDVPPLAGPRGLLFHNWPEADTFVAKLSEQMGESIACQHRLQKHSDHYPFLLQGVTTTAITGGRPERPVQHFMHMAGDTPEKISLEGLRDTAVFAARVLLRLATL
jgi:Iap family predicted aminopeptidase